MKRTEQDYIEFAKELNFEVIKFSHQQVPKRSDVHLLCKKCGASHIVTRGALAKKQVECEGCISNMYRDLLDKQDFDFLYRKRNGMGKNSEIIFRCRKDGTILIKDSALIRNNNRNCPQCRIQKITDKLLTRDCQYLYSKDKKIFFKNNNGEIYSAKHTNILRGEFAISRQLSAWEQHVSVYIFDLEKENQVFTKIGVSKDPIYRANLLKLTDVKITIVAEYSNHWEARVVEKMLHTRFNSNKLPKEESKKFLGSLFDGFPYDQGYTEWFTFPKEEVANRDFSVN
jgi:hypothetical protein